MTTRPVHHRRVKHHERQEPVDHPPDPPRPTGVARGTPRATPRPRPTPARTGSSRRCLRRPRRPLGVLVRGRVRPPVPEVERGRDVDQEHQPPEPQRSRTAARSEPSASRRENQHPPRDRQRIRQAIWATRRPSRGQYRPTKTGRNPEHRPGDRTSRLKHRSPCSTPLPDRRGLPSMPRRTKIVATLGPATDDPNVLAALLRAGVDVARINFSHGTADEHLARVARFRAEADRRVGKVVAVLADLPGPKLRVRIPAPRPLAAGGQCCTSRSPPSRRTTATSPSPSRRCWPTSAPDSGSCSTTAGCSSKRTETDGGRLAAKVVIGGTLAAEQGAEPAGHAADDPGRHRPRPARRSRSRPRPGWTGWRCRSSAARRRPTNCGALPPSPG